MKKGLSEGWPIAVRELCQAGKWYLDAIAGVSRFGCGLQLLLARLAVSSVLPRFFGAT